MSPLDPTLWGTRGPLDGLKESHIKRARKRTVRPTDTPYAWAVDGEARLGDSFDYYDVRYDEESSRYHCDCETHSHGETRRRRCTHKTAVVLYREEHGDPDEWAAERRGDRGVLPEGAPSAPRPHPSPPDENENKNVLGGNSRETAQPGNVVTLFTRHDLKEEPAPSHPMFGEPVLPERFARFRAGQYEVIDEIISHLENGVKVVMVSAPTGSGKTLIGDVTRRLYSPGRYKAAYMCATKTLQQQILHEFPYANTIMGRGNYPTLVPGVMADACTRTEAQGSQCMRCPTIQATDVRWFDGTEDKTYWHCNWCHPTEQCPYRIAKAIAVESHLPVLNMAYFINEIKAGYASRFADRELVIVDEADVLEDELMRQIEYTSTPRGRASLGITDLPLKTVPDDWRRWLSESVRPALLRAISRAEGGMRARGGGGTSRGHHLPQAAGRAVGEGRGDHRGHR